MNFLLHLPPLPGSFWHKDSQVNVLCLQLVFVTTEVSPWSKVGGLGDVLGALPVALAAR